MKKTLALILALITVLVFVSCTGGEKKDDVEDFYNDVYDAQIILDGIASTIYDYWYECIYGDSYYGDNVTIAVLAAQQERKDDIDVIKMLDEEIQEGFKKAKNSSHSEAVSAVMAAYSDYYEVVINVSGSFNSFRSDKETYKKALASALRQLKYEL